jgi:hypothetical protein
MISVNIASRSSSSVEGLERYAVARIVDKLELELESPEACCVVTMTVFERFFDWHVSCREQDIRLKVQADSQAQLGFAWESYPPS